MAFSENIEEAGVTKYRGEDDDNVFQFASVSIFILILQCSISLAFFVSWKSSGLVILKEDQNVMGTSSWKAFTLPLSWGSHYRVTLYLNKITLGIILLVDWTGLEWEG